MKYPEKLRAIAGLLVFVAASFVLLGGVFVLLDLRDSRAGPAHRITVGSKAFTESILLAELMALLIEAQTDIQVVRRTNLGGTQICFTALQAGKIDLYPEYTGTGLMAILEQSAVPDERAALEAVREGFEGRYAAKWLDPMAFNNTYALAMTEARAAALGISSISDLAAHPSLVAGFPSEFMARKDGYPGLRETYSLEFERPPQGMEAGLMYGAVASGRVDVISAYATDGRIDKFDLRVLEDDKSFFPPYQAAPLIHADVLQAYPQLRPALGVLSGKLDDERMRKLNARIDLGGEDPRAVAREVAAELLHRQTQ